MTTPITSLRLLTAAALATALLTSAACAQTIISGGGGRGPRPAPPYAPPGYSCIWVNPAYRTLTEQIWIPGTTQLVSDWLETSPGHLERIYREVTTPGHYETRTRSVLVSDGHWELVAVNPPIYISPPIYYYPPVVSPPIVVVSNPAPVPAIQTEDLSRFSPLYEWPK